MSQKNLINLSKGAMFIALAVGSAFALIMVPNVELMTAVVFTSGAYLGSKWGIVVGCIAEFIFSVANPLGSGLIFFPMLLAQVIGMLVIGAVGGWYKKFMMKKNWPFTRRSLLGFTGILLTFQFDALTTFSYPITMGYPMKQTFAIFISGIGFTFFHQISNGIIFALVLPKVFGRLQLGRTR